MRNEIFLDTSYAIALSSPKDNLHKKALHLATQIKLAGKRIVTTHAVMLEIGNSLSKLRHRRAVVSLLYALEVDPWVTIVPFSE